MPFLKAVIFDMDGVLIDARNWHFRAFSEALDLNNFKLDAAYHESYLDGLPTIKKLEILNKEFGLKKALFDTINQTKQRVTLEIAERHCKPEPDKQNLLKFLKCQGLQLGLCSNAKKSSIDFFMELAGLLHHFDCLLSCEDVPKPKPSPDIYVRGMELLGVRPENTLIVEDSEFGYQAAVESGGHVLRVSGPDDVNIEHLTRMYPDLMSGTKT